MKCMFSIIKPVINADTVASQDKETSFRQPSVSSRSLKGEDVSQDDHEGVLVAAGKGMDARCDFEVED